MEHQHHHQVQHQQHEKHQHQTMDSETQSLKLDLLTGRAGDPPGLGSCPGSSPKTEVKPKSNEIFNDHIFQSMSEEDLDWVEAALLDQGEASLTATARAVTASKKEDDQLLEMPDHPRYSSRNASQKGDPQKSVLIQILKENLLAHFQAVTDRLQLIS